MGGVESRFNALLVEGKADEAMQIWDENFDLQMKHQPNAQIKSSPHRDTPLHCTVRWEMKELMQEFLSRGGDPFTINGIGETPLHIVCRAAKFSSRRSKKRAEFLQLMLDRIPGEETFEVIGPSRSLEKDASLLEGSSHLSGVEERKWLKNGQVPGGLKMAADSDAHYLGTQDKVKGMQHF